MPWIFSGVRGQEEKVCANSIAVIQCRPMGVSPWSVSVNTSLSLGFPATKQDLPSQDPFVKRDISKTPYEIREVVRL